VLRPDCRAGKGLARRLHGDLRLRALPEQHSLTAANRCSLGHASPRLPHPHHAKPRAE
jgi:hypothetical protein